ncbi:hypothetical protein CW304_04975 [Bacillus sp. UFRGS-B20]|nr:hypothetical protein CW304_04975 [Bacillus sp. UFRGS-B20]
MHGLLSHFSTTKAQFSIAGIIFIRCLFNKEITFVYVRYSFSSCFVQILYLCQLYGTILVLLAIFTTTWISLSLLYSCSNWKQQVITSIFQVSD